MTQIKRRKTKFGYWKPTPKSKFIPNEYLCQYCHKRRIHKDSLCRPCILYVQWGHAAIKWCKQCNARPAEINSSYCEDCLKLELQKQILVSVNLRVDKKMPNLMRSRRNKHFPKNDKVPKNWKLKTCWQCGKPKGPNIPIESPFCIKCYITTCEDCSQKAFYTAEGEYKQWCKKHYYERIICHSCGSTKQLDGLTLCDPCRLKRANLLTFQLKKLWRRTPYACRSCESAPRLTGLKYCTACYTKIAFSPIKQRQQPGYQYELPFG